MGRFLVMDKWTKGGGGDSVRRTHPPMSQKVKKTCYVIVVFSYSQFLIPKRTKYSSFWQLSVISAQYISGCTLQNIFLLIIFTCLSTYMAHMSRSCGHFWNYFVYKLYQSFGYGFGFFIRTKINWKFVDIK